MIIARANTPVGEVVLRRREDVDELVVNGVFAMDSAEVTSELALADAAGSPPGRVLVGGLGLGYTAARLLDAGAEFVRVVELADPLITWAREGLTEQLGRVAADQHPSGRGASGIGEREFRRHLRGVHRENTVHHQFVDILPPAQHDFTHRCVGARDDHGPILPNYPGNGEQLPGVTDGYG